MTNITRFQKGRSGNPKGRPKGSRNKLTHKFLADVEKDWKKHGNEVLGCVRIANPEIYLRIVSNLIIKNDLEENQAEDHMTVEDARAELLRRLQQKFPIADEIDESDAINECQDISLKEFSK